MKKHSPETCPGKSDEVRETSGSDISAKLWIFVRFIKEIWEWRLFQEGKNVTWKGLCGRNVAGVLEELEEVLRIC